MMIKSAEGHLGSSPAEQCVTIELLFADFSESLAEEDATSTRYQVSSRILAAAVTAWNRDIDRVQQYTNRTINDVRTVSYLSYWIAKSKPIQLLDNEISGSSVDLFVNEMFALFLLFRFLKIDSQTISQTLYFELVHHIRFRNIDPETLYLVAVSLMQREKPLEF